MESFSGIVKQKREALGISQSKFAERIGVSWMTVWRWEKGLSRPKDDAKEHWLTKVDSLD